MSSYRVLQFKIRICRFFGRSEFTSHPYSKIMENQKPLTSFKMRVRKKQNTDKYNFKQILNFQNGYSSVKNNSRKTCFQGKRACAASSRNEDKTEINTQWIRDRESSFDHECVCVRACVRVCMCIDYDQGTNFNAIQNKKNFL